MTRSTMSAVACAVSLVFATPLLAQTSSATDQTTTSPATTSAAPTTPPPQATTATPSSCAGMTGTALSDCQNAENASNALCFGMNDRVRADCVKSYYPNSPQGRATPPATTGTTVNEPGRTEPAGPAGNASIGAGTGAPTNNKAISK